MTALEIFKSIPTFNIGDLVVYDNNVYRILKNPRFKYRVNYTDGDWDDYYEDDIEHCRENLTILGYVLEGISGNIFLKWYDLNIRLYDPIFDVKLEKHKQQLDLHFKMKELTESIKNDE